MARKRMFSSQIVGNDRFYSLPISAQCLYFHLGMSADDDGFTDSYKSIMNNIRASEDDLRILILKGYIAQFSTGVSLIIDWKINNTIKNDRYSPTQYAEEFSMLKIEKNKSYSINENIAIGNISVMYNKKNQKNGFITTDTTATIGTSMEPFWNQNNTDKNEIYSNDIKMEPKWNQNGTKMEPRKNPMEPFWNQNNTDKNKNYSDNIDLEPKWNQKKCTNYEQEVVEEKWNQTESLENSELESCSQFGNNLEPQYSIDKKTNNIYNNINNNNIYNYSNNLDEKKAYGMFQNVWLLDSEIEQLKERSEDYMNIIEQLSAHMAGENIDYDNHYAMVILWILRRESWQKGKTKETGKKNSWTEGELANSAYEMQDWKKFEKDILSN